MPLCQQLNCNKNAYYGYKHDGKKIACGKHYTQEMIYLLSRINRCYFEGCEKTAIFGFTADKLKISCSTHKKPDMTNLKHKRCMHDGCEIRASCGFVSDGVLSYCSQHKLANMVDLAHIKLNCIADGCMVQASFGLDSVGKPTHCKTHKTTEMRDLTNKNKVCVVDNCKVNASFGFASDNNKTHCSTHKLPEMINLSHAKDLCIVEGCKVRASFGTFGEKPTHCFKHKEQYMINMTFKKCGFSGCITKANSKYKNYCCYCFVNQFPDEPLAQNFKTKETEIVNRLQAQYPDTPFVFDKRIENGTSKRRPDVFVNLETHAIVLEVDENQHCSYDCSCENRRLVELSADVGHKPLVFIRFNPDDYIDNTGKKIASCFSIDSKSKLLVVGKKQTAQWESRIFALFQNFEYWLQNVPKKTIEVVQLFYDDCFMPEIEINDNVDATAEPPAKKMYSQSITTEIDTDYCLPCVSDH